MLSSRALRRDEQPGDILNTGNWNNNKITLKNNEKLSSWAALDQTSIQCTMDQELADAAVIGLSRV